MVEYTKISVPFVRDMEGTKKLIEGSFADPTVEMLQDIEWEFTEKIDGTNISVVWDGHKVEYHGRTERASIPSPLQNRLNAIFSGETNEELFEQVFGDTNAILFGEGYGAKIQNGGLYRDDVDFILFDVYFPDRDMWLPRDAVADIAAAFGISAVPVVLVGTINNAVAFVKQQPRSTIGTAPMEGVVGRPKRELKRCDGKRIITKIKVRDFESLKGTR